MAAWFPGVVGRKPKETKLRLCGEGPNETTDLYCCLL